MLIPTHIEVFEDPKYCSISGTLTGSSDKCGYGSLSLCRAFVDRNYSPVAREYDHTYHAFKKCDQCKKNYQTELKRREDLEEDKVLKPLFARIMENEFPDVSYTAKFSTTNVPLDTLTMTIKDHDPEPIQKRFEEEHSALTIIAVNTAEECEFDCEKYGLPKDSHQNQEVCKNCPNTPPF